MRVIKKSIILLFIASTTFLNAQVNPMLSHVKVYEATDSIVTNLYFQGIDTLISMHRVWDWEKQKSYDCAEEIYSSLILWFDEGKFYYQLINEYAIYQPKREYRKGGLLLYLFRYYFINEEEINSNPIKLKYLMKLDESKPIEELVYGGGDFNILTYKIGKLENEMCWYTPNLRLDDPSIEYEIFDSKSFIWASLIEREFRKTINTYWKPIKIKVSSIEETSTFFSGLEGQFNKWKQEIKFLKESHAYKHQEILIPKKFYGIITIVQGLPCGERISIKDSIRTITIPKSGNLILDTQYISYNQEYGSSSEKQKNLAFFVKGNKREPLTLLSDSNKPNDFGLSVLGEFDWNINSKKYNIVVMYVGLKQEAQIAYNQQKFHDEKLPVLLENCNK